MKFLSNWLLLAALFVSGGAYAQMPAQDLTNLSAFYSATGGLYSQVKSSADGLLKKEISAQAFAARMTQWQAKASHLDVQAPCSKNNWQVQYSELTPAHHDMCSAWTSLKEMQRYLLNGDAEVAIYHEQQYRELMLDVAAKIENPELNQTPNFFED